MTNRIKDLEPVKLHVSYVGILCVLYGVLLYIEPSISFLIRQKRTVNFLNQRRWHDNCRLYNNHVKDTQGHG